MASGEWLASNFKTKVRCGWRIGRRRRVRCICLIGRCRSGRGGCRSWAPGMPLACDRPLRRERCRETNPPGSTCRRPGRPGFAPAIGRGFVEALLTARLKPCPYSFLKKTAAQPVFVQQVFGCPSRSRKQSGTLRCKASGQIAAVLTESPRCSDSMSKPFETAAGSFSG